jgi:hypothetical protein
VDGQPHRDEGKPAVIWAAGGFEWLVNGQYTRAGSDIVVCLRDGSSGTWNEESQMIDFVFMRRC